MSRGSAPTISVVVAAYQAERWIGEALDSILGQTRPPDEVVVVDDGSTDGTARELQRFGGRIRVVWRPNGGCPAAFNTAFAHARGDWVAMCGADDVWEPRKLEWQEEAITANSAVDVLFGHAVRFGLVDTEHARPSGRGVLDTGTLRTEVYRESPICAPTVVIRRALFERLGPFIEDFGADDFEYWMRCLRAGTRFYYDPRPLVRWRHHGDNLSWRTLWMDQCVSDVHRWYARDIPDRRLVRELLAPELFRVGRALVDDGRPGEARTAFARSLRNARGTTPSWNARALVWVLVLCLPSRARELAGRTLVSVSRSIDALTGRRTAAAE